MKKGKLYKTIRPAFYHVDNDYSRLLKAIRINKGSILLFLRKGKMDSRKKNTSAFRGTKRISIAQESTPYYFLYEKGIVVFEKIKGMDLGLYFREVKSK